MKQVNKGFTLIELLLVITIIGIFVAGGMKAYSVWKNYTESSSVLSNAIRIADAIDFVTENKLKPQLNATLVSTSKLFPSGINYDPSTLEGTDADGNIYSFSAIDPATHTALFPRLIHSLSAYSVNVSINDRDVCDYLLKDAFNHFKLIGTNQGVVVKNQNEDHNFEQACAKPGNTATVYLINP